MIMTTMMMMMMMMMQILMHLSFKYVTSVGHFNQSPMSTRLSTNGNNKHSFIIHMYYRQILMHLLFRDFTSVGHFNQSPMSTRLGKVALRAIMRTVFL
jgi:hypothetical protein